MKIQLKGLEKSLSTVAACTGYLRKDTKEDLSFLRELDIEVILKENIPWTEIDEAYAELFDALDLFKDQIEAIMSQ